MNKRRYGPYKRLLALVLALTMCFSMLQIYAYANENDPQPQEPGPSEPAAAQPIDPPAPETFVGQAGEAGRDSWIEGGSAQDQAQDLLDQAGTDASLETTTSGPETVGSKEVLNDNGGYDHTETTTETTDSWNGAAGDEETGKVDIKGSETTTTTTSTVPAGEENPPRVIGDKTEVDGKETITYDKKTETVDPEGTSAPMSARGLEEYIEETENGKKPITVTAPGKDQESSTADPVVIGTVNQDRIVEAKKEEALGEAEKAKNQADDEAIKNLVEIDGFQPKLDKDGNGVTDENGNIVYVKTEAISGDGESGSKTTEITRDSSVVTNHKEGDTSFETVTKVVTTTKETTTAYKAPDDQPLKDVPENQLTPILDQDGNEIGKTTTSQDPETLAITVTRVYQRLDEDGKPFYEAVYVTTSSDGMTVTTRTETVKGETAYVETMTTVTETKTETTAVNVAEDERTVTVTMSGVTTGSGVVDNDGNTHKHGEIYTSGLGRPNGSIETNANDLRIMTDEATTPSDSDKKEDYRFFYDGKDGLASDFYVDIHDLPEHLDWSHVYAHQFELLDTQNSNATHYGYCTDLVVSPHDRALYEMKNLEESGYFTDSTDANGNIITGADKVAMVRAMATNGYWGTNDTGIGSLAAFKSFLEDTEIDLTDEEIALITDGLALSITQAVIWKYGNSFTNDPQKQSGVKDNPFTDVKDNVDNNQNKMDVGNKIYSYLTDSQNKDKVLSAGNSTRNDTATINAEDITGTTVTVVSTNSSADRTTYNTDISFNINVKNSKLNSNNLQVALRVTGKEPIICSVPKESEIAGTANSDKFVVTKNNDGTYTLTIKGVVLDTESDISINLSGTQNVVQDAYILKAENGYSSSQTFVVVESGTRYVDLGFNLTFKAVEPVVEIVQQIKEITETHSETTRTWHAERENSYAQMNYPRFVPTPTPAPSEEPTPTPSEEPTPTPSEEPTPEPTDEPIEDDPVPLGTPTPEPSDEPIEDDPVPLGTPTPEPNEPEEPEEPEEELPDPDIPLAPSEPEEELPDPDVPLADVPKTGDGVELWYLLALASGFGLLLLAVSGRKQRAAKR